MTPRTSWACIWAGWAGYFAVAEAVGIRKGHPLCHFLRPILGTKGSKAHKAAGATALMAFAVWFVPHLYREDS